MTINKTKRRCILAAGIILAVILLISLLLHYPVRILDALTQEPVAGYGIRISPWRIIFEPFLGLLLYFNRSLYALSEVPWALVWLFSFYFIFILWKGFATGKRQERKKWLTARMVDIPLIIGGLFIIFLLLIFIRLPGNTIVNHTPDTVLVTTHCHTEYSHDGLIPQKKLWKWHKRNGFDAFFITDHNHHDKTLDFMKAQRNGDFEIEPLVMCGEEFSGTNHLSLLGLKRKFSTHGFPDSVAVDSTKASGGAVIVNHWFDGEHKTLEYYRDLGVDGFEIGNTATDRYYDRKIYNKIKSFCLENHLIMNGGLDFHGYGNVCSLWNAFEIPGWHQMSPEEQEESILHILKTRDQGKLKVLLYNDRPYYEKKNLFFRPGFTFFNYFRTLNILQILSWIFWMAIVTWLTLRISARNESESGNLFGKIVPVSAMAGALFMLGLGLIYYIKAGRLADFNDVYKEYSTLLFYAGIAFLIYSTLVTYFRLMKRR
ncbi:MAG: PHP domain-containing protein [Chlorobi bacterium]|nr:PHP domain-containing protein [Chlorobiota bacterium]